MLTFMADMLMMFRYWVILLYIIITSVLLYFAGQIGFQYSFRQFFPENNQEVMVYDQTIKDFGEDDTSILVAIEGKNIFTRKTLEIYQQFQSEVEEITDVVDVDSILNAPRPQMKDDTLVIEPLFDPLPENQADYEERKQYLLNSELYSGSFISDDGEAVLMIVKIDPEKNNGNDRKPALNKVRELAAKLANDTQMKLVVGGVPVTRSGYTDLMTNETMSLTTYSGILILFILIISFRHWAGVFFSLAIVFMATLAPIGIMAMLGIHISLMSTILPIIVMITGVANSIHFHTRFYEELHKGKTKKSAIRETTSHLAIALFITSVTTSVGFSILALTDIQILREFGIFTGVGVVSAYLITITFLPAVLSIIPVPPDKMLDRFFAGQSQKFLDMVHFVTTEKRLLSVLGCLIFGLTTAYFASTVERKQRLLDDLDSSHPIIVTQSYFEDTLGNVLPLEILLDTEKKNGVKQVAVMNFAEQAKKHLASYDSVGKIYSPSDLIQEMSSIFTGKYELPKSRQETAQYFMLYAMSEQNPMEALASKKYERTRVSARVRDIYSGEARSLFAKVEKWLKANTPEGIKSTLTGLSPVAHMINSYVVDQIFYSFLIALLIITLLLILQFRSIKLGLFSLIPNMFPLATLLGLIGMLHINLKPSSAITFSIALGIAVDDTVHYITRFIQEYQKRHDSKQASKIALFGTGKAMVYTTIVLACGFSVPIFVSDVRANTEFGLLSTAAVIVALVADLFLLPVILPLLFRGNNNSEDLSL